MRRRRPNPFTVLLGVVGIAFTLTASAFCIAVLRGVRVETARQAPHGLDRLVSRYGTTALAVELVLLAVATVGSIAVDDLDHRRTRRRMREESLREDRERLAGTPPPPADGAGS
ncbi:MAG: hypothetical protein ACKO5R_07005 [Planctomycetaceae bacterium]